MLTIGAADLEALVAHCRRELPNEGCGFLAGRGGEVLAVLPVRSVQASPARYAMDPAEQLRALEQVRISGREVVGIYHSHPSGPDAPSAADLQGALWPGSGEPSYPGAVQVIVSFAGRAEPVVRAYAVVAGRFSETPIVVRASPAQSPATAGEPSRN